MKRNEKQRVEIRYEKDIPKGLKIGKNKIKEEGKTVRVIVKKHDTIEGQSFHDGTTVQKGKASDEFHGYKIIYNRR